MRISNSRYEAELKANGELVSRLLPSGVAVTRPSYEVVDPAGRALFITEVLADGAQVSWPVLGNFMGGLYEKADCRQIGNTLVLVREAHELRTTVSVRLPDDGAALELWTVTVENLADRPRNLKLTPYLEWLLDTAEKDRNHTQYNRLYPEMSYKSALNALFALHRHSHKIGLLAAADRPQGFLTGRVDFIGRAGTIRQPRALQTFDFMECRDCEAYPTFDPIGALLLDISIEAQGHTHSELLVGCTDSHEEGAQWIGEHLGSGAREDGNAQPAADSRTAGKSRKLLIGHGEVLPGTPLPYAEYEQDGAVLHVRTPFTPRPFDHTMSNALGHVLCVTNRGLHSSASGNSQQNRLTPDWADLTGREVPPEAFYIYEAESNEWFSPTYEPLRDGRAVYDARFGLDGSAVFNMRRAWMETELTVHVPHNEPSGVYLLTIRNRGDRSRKVCVAPYFQMVLGHSPETAGSLNVDYDDESGVLYFDNPQNDFCKGPAFVAMSRRADEVVTERAKFFGRGGSFAHPSRVAGVASAGADDDRGVCAAMLVTVEIAAGSEESLVVVLGQSGSRSAAQASLSRLRTVEVARASLAETAARWKAFVSRAKVSSSDPEFDSYLDWMKYQALAERIWARKGFYQASGAFGFRDQLQDTVNLIWVDPALARQQLILHAGQQFIEGDVAHWFFLRQDGSTGLLSRSHASDNLLWLGWGVAEYVRMTGDKSLLDETAHYLEADEPLPPLPQGKAGMALYPRQSTKSDSVYAHVMRAIDLVFDKRMGANGLPLIGTGDWNDGLDEIGSEGRGESVWLAFFLCYIMQGLLDIIEERDGATVRADYEGKLERLKAATEKMWRGDRYLRAIHDDGTEIGVAGAGYWEIDALTAAWAVYADINFEHGRTAVDTALSILERENVICLGYPPLRADTKPYLGRSSLYPEGVRENGMYSHGVQWLVMACRILSERFEAAGDRQTARHYRDATARLWYKIAAISHTTPQQIEIYGGQPNKQAADYLTEHEPGRMIWNGYTGAAGWMLRQGIEGVLGYRLENGQIKTPQDIGLERGKLCGELIAQNEAK